MKKILLYSCCVILMTLQACASDEQKNIKAQGTKTNAWDYNDQVAWGAVSSVCIEGIHQSPINIERTNTVPSEKELVINYTNITVDTLTNVGYAINALVSSNQSISYDGDVYDLLQFHYHADAEHSVDSKLDPFEIHFVHQIKKGDRLAVIGVFFKEGKANAAIQTLLDNSPKKYSETYNQQLGLALSDLIPNNRKFYSYDGSLTTPGCAEIVNWIVMSEPLEMSLEQLKAIRTLLNGKNNRDIQELNNRTVSVTEVK